MLHFPKLNTGIQSIDSQWGKLCRKVQAYIEHHPVTNAIGSAVVRGQCLAPSGDRSMDLTDAANEATSYFTGIASEPQADGEQFVMTTSNFERVWMESGLAPAAGNPLFLSETRPGAATTTNLGQTFIARIGIILDASMYDDGVYEYVDAIIVRCCTPSEGEEF